MNEIEKTKAELEHLLMYYQMSRNVGHTRTMIEGLKSNSDALIISGTQIAAENIGRHAGIKRSNCIGWGLIGFRNLRGSRQAIAIDNYGITTMLSGALKAIRTLEFVIKMFPQPPYSID